MKRQSFSSLLVVIPLTIAGIVWFLADGSPGPAGKQKNAGIPAGAPVALDVRQVKSKESRSLTVEDTSGEGPAAAATGGTRGGSSGFSAVFQPARQGAVSVAIPTDSPRSAPRETTVLTSDFLESIVDASRKRVRFTLPDGTIVGGTVELLRSGDQGIVSVQGFVEMPEAGEYFFQKQTTSGTAGAMIGHVRFDNKDWGWKISPTGPGHAPVLHTAGLGQVLCVGKPMPDSPEEPPGKFSAPADSAQGIMSDKTTWQAPQDHPDNLPIPAIQNGVIVLESLPGADGVIYLDFDGEPGPFTGWSRVTTAVEPSGNSNAQIKDIWQRVAEDFQPFNLNITTDRRVYDRARETKRQHIIITPTSSAAPSAGGVAYIGSFNWSADNVGWVFVLSGRNAAEAISHEVGHTLGLSHDGRESPSEDYYEGHGTGDVSWAPLMGTGYGRNVTQWSKGEYANANNLQDDLRIITNNNNLVHYREDDCGSTWATAQDLDLLPDSSVSSEGIIETRADVDAWRFETSGGQASLIVSTVNASANLDILAEIHDRNDVLITSPNPDNQLGSAITTNLPAGQYTLRVSGTGRGDPKTTGYSDYGSLGAYLISGRITNGIRDVRFTLDENTPAGTLLGQLSPRRDHGAHPVSYTITSGNTGGAFAISPGNGRLTVANAGVLDYETLSSKPGAPAVFELFVAIKDSADPLLNELLRVTVIINPINEAPNLSASGVTIFTNTRPGTPVLTVTGSDPDRSDFPSFSIARDDSGGVFDIDPATGLITIINTAATVPVSPYQLTLRARDQAIPPLITETTISITVLEAPAGYNPGGLLRSYYEAIPSSLVSNLSTDSQFANNLPDAMVFQATADGGSHGSNYGSTARAWLLPPATGSYTFWISGDDSAELRLSTNESPAAATILASAPEPTGRYQYDKYPTQQSVPVTLSAGRPYYLESRHKQAVGSDHLVIAWEGPGFRQQVISGLYLVPFEPNGIYDKRFALDENTPAGTLLGRLTPHKDHGVNPLRYAITSGNTGGAFTINSNTAQLSVAMAEVLDYEALSDGTGEPVQFALMVTITDSVDPLLNEHLRVGMTMYPVNEAPTLSAGDFTIFTRTRPGTPVLTVTGSDPDRFDFASYSIARSDPSGVFAIDSTTGLISVANAPATLPLSPYQLTIRASDQADPPLSTEATISITVLEAPAGYNPGGLIRSFYDDIPGTIVSNLSTHSKFLENDVDSEEFASMADLGRHGSNYGSAARAWLLPATGSYTFWISGDDSAELRLNTNESPFGAGILASTPASTGRYEFVKFPSQQSAPVTLTAGTPYYLEARHKKSSGAEHLVIAWEGPKFSQGVISGAYLVPHRQNHAPKIAAQSFPLRREADTGTRIGTVIASDYDGDALASFTITGGTAASWCAIDANTGLLYVKDAAALRAATATSANLNVLVSDDGSPPLAGAGLITLNLSRPEDGGAAGIIQEIWTGIAGNTVASLTSDPRYPDSPTTTRFFTIFDTDSRTFTNYGSRIRTLVEVPTTGSYQFHISSTGESQLFFSTESSGRGARQIASVPGSTERYVWDKFPSQRSAAIGLKAGQKAYLEVRHKAGSAEGFVQVAWTTSGRFTPLILAGSDLGVVDTNQPPIWSAPAYQFSIRQGSPAGTTVGTVVATDPEAGRLNYSITSGNTHEAFSLNPYTGTLTLTNPVALIPGQSWTLAMRVQDDGIKGLYPLHTATATATIKVVRDFALLSPKTPTVNLPAGQGLELETAGSGRPGASLAWSKINGPGDVGFDSPGSPVTGATFNTPGFYVIRATEMADGIPLTLDVMVQSGATPGLPNGGSIGSSMTTPTHSYQPDTWQINAAGTGWGDNLADSGYFIHQSGGSGVSMMARITSVQNVRGDSSVAGLMIREGPAPDARSIFWGITSLNGQRVITRSTPGFPSLTISQDNAGSSLPFAPVWLRLNRSGVRFSAFIAPDLNGLPGPFASFGPEWTLPMNTACTVGMASASGSAEKQGTFTMDGLKITPSLANRAPVITVEELPSLSLRDTALLKGTISDDALPADAGPITSLWKETSGPGTVTFGSASVPVTTASFSQIGLYQLRLTTGDGEVRTFRDVRLSVGVPPLESWRWTKFGETTALPSRSGDLADPDQDTLGNLLEYALNLDPLQPSVPDTTPVISEVDGRRYPGLNVIRNPGATDITMRIESTSTPDVASSWVSTGIVVEINTPTQLRARTTIPIDQGSRQFLRLKVIR